MYIVQYLRAGAKVGPTHGVAVRERLKVGRQQISGTAQRARQEALQLQWYKYVTVKLDPDLEICPNLDRDVSQVYYTNFEKTVKNFFNQVILWKQSFLNFGKRIVPVRCWIW